MNPVIVVTLLLGASYIVTTDMYIRRLSRELKQEKENRRKAEGEVEGFRRLLYEESQRVAEYAPRAIAYRLHQEIVEAQQRKAETPSGTQER